MYSYISEKNSSINVRTFKIILSRNEVERYMKNQDDRLEEINNDVNGIEVGEIKFTMKTRSRTLEKRTSKKNTNEMLPSIGRNPMKFTRNLGAQAAIEVFSPKRKRKQSDNSEESKFVTPGMQTRSRTLKEHTIEPKRKRIEENIANRTLIITERPKLMSMKRRVKKMPKTQPNALMPTLHEYELVWAYIKGYPSWPGVIEEFMPNGKYRIHFFGDYTRAEVPRRCIINYFEGFNQFACNFGNIKLRKAVEEANFFLFGNDDASECYVCKVLEYKSARFFNSNEK